MRNRHALRRGSHSQRFGNLKSLAERIKHLNSTKRLAVALAVALAVPAVAIGCGGDDDTGEDPQALLEAAFNNDTTIESGVIDISGEFSAEGEMGGSLSFSLSGPFQQDPENPDGVPQLDWDLSANAEGAAAEGFEGFEAGVIVTEDNLFVDYQDETYELGAEQFSQLEEQAAQQAGASDSDSSSLSFKEGCEQAIDAQGGDPAACDFDVITWFGDLSNEGSEDKGGAETTHIAGSLNVQAMLEDLFNLGASVPGATGGVDPALIQSQLETVSSAISEASFNVYPATEDDTLRALDFNLAIDPSQIPGGDSAGIDSASLLFAFEIADVGAEQSFEAPEDAKPIEDLIGSVGSIPGLGGGSLPDSGGSSGGDLGTIDPDCLDNAGSDPDAIQACLE
ncbi:hypothetical protein BH24ACT23_BH24ACT23_10780 [soil metagenome]